MAQSFGAMQIRVPRSEKDFSRYFDLRWQMLRQPWAQPRGTERDLLEDTSEHAMICGDEGQVLAVGRLHFNSPAEAQIRYMATAPQAQGQGLGRRIAGHLELLARHKGAQTIVLNAREGAIGFYVKLGYEVVGPAPTLFDAVPHAKMSKRL